MALHNWGQKLCLFKTEVWQMQIRTTRTLFNQNLSSGFRMCAGWGMKSKSDHRTHRRQEREHRWVSYSCWLSLEAKQYVGNARVCRTDCFFPGSSVHHPHDLGKVKLSQPIFSSEKWKLLVALSPPILCNPMDCSPPGSSVCRILQTRILE